MWQEMTGRMWNMAKTSAKMAVGTVTEKGTEALKTVDETARSLASGVGAATHKALDQAQELGQKATTEITKVTESAKVAAEIAAEVASDKAQVLAGQIAETASAAAQMAKEQVGKAATAVKEKAQEATATGERLLENATYLALQEHYGPDWLIRLIEGLDYAAIAAQVARNINEHTGASPEALAERAVNDKCWNEMPLSRLQTLFEQNSLIPEDLQEFLNLTAAQAETILEVAGACALDVTKPERKGEILLILGTVAGAEDATIELARQALSPDADRSAGPVMQTFARQVGIGLSRKSLLRQLPVLGKLFGKSLTYASLMLVGSAARQFYSQQAEAGTGTAEGLTQHLATFTTTVSDLTKVQHQQQHKHYQILLSAALADQRLSIPERHFLESFLAEAGFPEEERRAWLETARVPAPLDDLAQAITIPQERRALFRQVVTLTTLQGPPEPAAQAFLHRLASVWGLSVENQ